LFKLNTTEKINHLHNYLQFDNAVKKALQQLQVIFNEQHSLDSIEVKAWIKEHQQMYKCDLLSFDVAYLDHENTTADKLYISESNTFVNATQFKSIIAFCKIESLLLGNGYHLNAEEEQPMLADYYYQPNRNYIEDLNLIESYLKAD
jgi:hypothetical protein